MSTAGAVGRLRLVSVASLGLYVGAMLTEGFVLVPYWRSLQPSEFFAWYAANDIRLFRFFGAVTVLVTVAVVADALTSLFRRDSGWRYVLLAGGLVVAAVALFPVYFEEANASFASGSVSAADLPAELARWAMWHWVRTALSCAALAASLLSLRTMR